MQLCQEFRFQLAKVFFLISFNNETIDFDNTVPSSLSLYNFISSSFDQHCVCITEYEVWYRHDSQPEIDEIPDLDYRYSDCRHLTLDELLSATHRLTVTHMCIRGDIPPLGEIAPHLKQLKLNYPPYRDQSDRSVSLCISSLLTTGSDNLYIRQAKLIHH